MPTLKLELDPPMDVHHLPASESFTTLNTQSGPVLWFGSAYTIRPYGHLLLVGDLNIEDLLAHWRARAEF